MFVLGIVLFDPSQSAQACCFGHHRGCGYGSYAGPPAGAAGYGISTFGYSPYGFGINPYSFGVNPYGFGVTPYGYSGVNPNGLNQFQPGSSGQTSSTLNQFPGGTSQNPVHVVTHTGQAADSDLVTRVKALEDKVDGIDKKLDQVLADLKTLKK
jgi:hypothetical protein